MAVQRQVGAMTDAKESAEDLTGKEFYFATRTAAGLFRLCGNGEKIAGVISEGRPAGAHTSVNTGNQLKAIAGGEINVGDSVQSNGAGEAITGATNPIGTAINHALDNEMVEINVDRV